MPLSCMVTVLPCFTIFLDPAGYNKEQDLSLKNFHLRSQGNASLSGQPVQELGMNRLFLSASRRLKSFLGGLLVVALVVPALSMPSAAEGSDLLSRPLPQEVQNAFQAVRRESWDRAYNWIRRSDDPLAADLYRWAYYRDHANRPQRSAGLKDMAAFLRRHPEWPDHASMRLHIEKQAVSEWTAQEIIAWHSTFEPMTPEGLARYVSALNAMGQDRAAASAGREYWRKSGMTQEQQLALFTRLKPYLQESDHHYRIDQLIGRKYYTNARDLARMIGKGWPDLVEARIALRHRKPNVDALIARVPPALRKDPGLTFDRLNWRRDKDLNDRALQILDSPPAQEEVYNPYRWWRERRILTRRLLAEKDYARAYRTAAGHIQKPGSLGFAEAEFLSGWIALRYTENDYAAFEHFERLYYAVETPISRARAAYWAARASEELGDGNVARQWDNVAARYPSTFYGQLSAAAQGGDLRTFLPGVPPQATEPRLTPALQAALILYKTGSQSWADDFVQAAVAELDSTPAHQEFWQAALGMAAYFQRTPLQVQLSRSARSGGGLALALESGYPELRMAGHQGRRFGLPAELVHALIRQESGFDAEVRSHAGAFGLMQLMPATARGEARRNGWRYSDAVIRTNPHVNVKLGSSYLARLIDRFEGSIILALAGYNGGPNRVARWLEIYGDPRRGEIGWVDWIEHIPIPETQNYVQRVLEGYRVYQARMREGPHAHETGVMRLALQTADK